MAREAGMDEAGPIPVEVMVCVTVVDVESKEDMSASFVL